MSFQPGLTSKSKLVNYFVAMSASNDYLAVGLPGTAEIVPVFQKLEALREFFSKLEIDYHTIAVIEDHDQFIKVIGKYGVLINPVVHDSGAVQCDYAMWT